MSDSCNATEHSFVQAAGSEEMIKKIVLLYCQKCGDTKILKIDDLVK